MNIFKTCAFLMAVMLLPPCVRSQEQDRRMNVESFDVQVGVFPGSTPQQSRANVDVWVNNTKLQFIKTDTTYLARYQINLEIYQNQKTIFLTRDTTVTVIERKYPSTIDPKIYRIHQFHFSLTPNEYLFKMRLMDLNSDLSYIQQTQKKVPVFDAAKLALSDILFLNSENLEKIVLQNLVSPMRIPIQDNIYLFTEIVSSEASAPLHIDVIFNQRDSARKMTLSQQVERRAAVTPIFIALDKNKMVLGENEILVTVTAAGQSAEQTKTVRFITAGERFAGLQTTNMIDPLTYIAKSDEWKQIHTAAGEQQQEYFKAFWDKRDPTQGTVENELFDEFYRRVSFSDQNFAEGKIAGWRTDRGHVYIIYGEPDNIERGSSSTFSQSNYEIWYYNDLAKKFVFLDEHGFGDYHLVSGIDF
jgi:GWxTD domain-containing protein